MKAERIIKTTISLFILLSSTISFGAEPKDWSIYPNFSELREEIGWGDNYESQCNNSRSINEISDFMNSEQWSDAIELGSQWLDQCPIDILTHYFVAISYNELGDDMNEEVHITWLRGLMDSVVESGDGKTPETAYVTISVSEEYDVLYVFGIQPISQGLVDGEYMVDAFTFERESGEEDTIYFNPAAHFSRLSKFVESKPSELLE